MQIKTISDTNQVVFDKMIEDFICNQPGEITITFHPLMNESRAFIMFIAHIIY